MTTRTIVTGRGALFLMLFLILPEKPLWATSFFPRAFPESVEEAPLIMRGKIGMTYSDWGHDAENIKRIYTYFELQVSESLKGEVASPQILIRELGGEKDGVALSVTGASHFQKGEETIVFLKDRNAEGTYDMHGMMMGKYNLVSGPNGEEVLTGAGLMNQPPGATQRWTLEDLRKLIREQAASHPVQRQGAGQDSHALAQKIATPVTSPSPPASAPQLQPAPTEEIPTSTSGVSRSLAFAISTAVGIMIAIWYFQRRKRG